MNPLERDLPDFIDLVVTSVECGSGLDTAVQEAAQHLPGPLATEMTRAQREIFSGTPRRDAYLKLVARSSLPELGTFVGQLIQAEAMGTTVGGALRSLAVDARHRQFARAKEQAARLPTQMTVVNVLFIPALLASLLGACAAGKLQALIVLAVAAFVLIPRFVPSSAVRTQRALESQLADWLRSLAGCMRTGMSLPAALSHTALLTLPPLQMHASALAEAARVGDRLAEALTRFATTTGSRDARLFVAAVQVHLRTGGNLSEVLLNLSETIAERVRLRRDLQGMTAQPRFTGMILTALPLGLAVLAIGARLAFSVYDGLFSFIGPNIGALVLAAAVGLQWLIITVIGMLTSKVEAVML